MKGITLRHYLDPKEEFSNERISEVFEQVNNGSHAYMSMKSSNEKKGAFLLQHTASLPRGGSSVYTAN